MSTPAPSVVPTPAALAALHDPEPTWLNELQTHDFPTPRTAVPGLLYTGLCLLAGNPKSRKSWLALDLSVAIATGSEFLGRVCPQGRVLYCDIEYGSSARRAQKRVRELLAEYGYGDDDPWPERLGWKWRVPRLDEGLGGMLEAYLDRYPDTRLIVIDPLQQVRAPGRDEGTYGADYRLGGALAEIAVRRQVCILAIHHLRKMSADDPLHEVSGTTGLTGSVDGIWLHRANSSKTGASLFITGRDIEEDQDVQLTRAPYTARWQMDPATQVRGSEERRLIREAMHRVGWPQTIRDLHDQLRDTFTYDALRKNLQRMRDDGEVTFDPGSTNKRARFYILTPKGVSNVSGDVVRADIQTQQDTCAPQDISVQSTEQRTEQSTEWRF